MRQVRHEARLEEMSNVYNALILIILIVNEIEDEIGGEKWTQTVHWKTFQGRKSLVLAMCKWKNGQLYAYNSTTSLWHRSHCLFNGNHGIFHGGW
jgi:hypothetical protein